MKKTMLFTAALAAFAMLASCQKEQITETPADTTGVTEFTAEIEAVRTAIAADGKVSWNVGDEIVITDAAKNSAIYVAASTGASTTFNLKSGQTAVGDGPYTATYGNINKQVYDAAGANCPLVAPETNSKELHFSSPYAVVKITAQSLSGDVIKKIIVATSEWGYTLDCGSGVALTSGGTSFYVSLDAANYSKFSVTLFTEDKMVTRTRKEGVSLAAKDLLPVTLTFSSTDWSDRHDFVVVKGTKWAVNNLAISESGKKSWKGTGTSVVTVPGTGEDVIIGDWFQWATYAGYSGEATDPDKGLLLYTSFKFKGVGDNANSFVMKDSNHTFRAQDSPYRIMPENSGFSKYTKDGECLEPSDDAANIILGGSWRMPTKDEHVALKNATYWVWDETAAGYYVYVPNPASDAGKHTVDAAETYNKSDALLFFNCPGFAQYAKFPYDFPAAQNKWRAFYWSSTCKGSAEKDNAYDMYLCGKGAQGNFNAASTTARFYGCFVRPVLD